jgi:hypothetical protein
MTGPGSLAAIPIESFLFRLCGVYIVSNASIGVLCVLEASGWPPPLLPMLLGGLCWALIGQVLTPILLAHLLLGGPPVVSHDVVPHDIVGPGVLIPVLLLLAAGVCARAWAAGRWLSYACVAALTLAVGVDLVGWMRQGL